jgi:ATP-binding cassette subfamily B protein
MRRGLYRVGLRAVRLAVGSAPGLFAEYAALTVLGGVLPVAVAWLTKLVLDRIDDRSGSLDALLGLAAGSGMPDPQSDRGRPGG